MPLHFGFKDEWVIGWKSIASHLVHDNTPGGIGTLRNNVSAKETKGTVARYKDHTRLRFYKRTHVNELTTDLQRLIATGQISQTEAHHFAAGGDVIRFFRSWLPAGHPDRKVELIFEKGTLLPRGASMGERPKWLPTQPLKRIEMHDGVGGSNVIWQR